MKFLFGKQDTENKENDKCDVTKCVDGAMRFKLKIFQSNSSFDLFSSTSFYGVSWFEYTCTFYTEDFIEFLLQ